MCGELAPGQAAHEAESSGPSWPANGRVRHGAAESILCASGWVWSWGDSQRAGGNVEDLLDRVAPEDGGDRGTDAGDKPGVGEGHHSLSHSDAFEGDKLARGSS